MKREKNLLILLAILILTLNYSWIDSFLVKIFQDYEVGVVERVIDGDTVVVNGTSIRLLGINSPEKGEVGYGDAKNFLEDKVSGKEIRIYFGKDKFDKYGRKLGYIFLGVLNVNLESVRLGYSNFYFPSGKDQYYKEFVDAWNDCLGKEINLCERSLEGCVVLEKWDSKEEIVVLSNVCDYGVYLNGWSVKDEGRKKYVFGNKSLKGFEKVLLSASDWGKDYVWTDSGDSIFVRDSENKLVIFDSY